MSLDYKCQYCSGNSCEDKKYSVSNGYDSSCDENYSLDDEDKNKRNKRYH